MQLAVDDVCSGEEGRVEAVKWALHVMQGAGDIGPVRNEVLGQGFFIRVVADIGPVVIGMREMRPQAGDRVEERDVGDLLALAQEMGEPGRVVRQKAEVFPVGILME